LGIKVMKLTSNFIKSLCQNLGNIKYILKKKTKQKNSLI